jgi:hypothetical protein
MGIVASSSVEGTGSPSAIDRGMAIQTQADLVAEHSGSEELTGWVSGATVRTHHSDFAATRAVAEAAARRASRPELPPLEWRLLNSARVLRDNRRAVIDAATAAEVAEPTRDEVHRAIKEAQTLLETYSPLPEFALIEAPESVRARVPTPS